MFLDEAIIEVDGGNGGRGCVSWRREKYVPKGGPDGGDGGRGGNVILVVDENADTLSDFTSRKRFEAPAGNFGMGKNKRGKDGQDLLLLVPPGTVISEVVEDGAVEKIADLQHHGEQMIVARGGRGGFGNAHFLSSVRQRPDFAELGEPGEKRRLKLELKLVADVGIIGYPSVGKSTLISVISAARPKIADYPFTTLIPNLGVVTVGERSSVKGAVGRSYVVCDVPGLIEGASEGKGLGDTFLRHIERCGVLLHMLDISRALEDGGVSADLLAKDYETIRNELVAYSPDLAKKRELVLLNKIDLVGGDSKAVEKALAKKGIAVFLSISSATKGHTDELVTRLLPIVLEEREKRFAVPGEEESTEELPVLRPHVDSVKMGAYRIVKEGDALHVRGKRIEQFTKMTDFARPGGLGRFRNVLDRIGLLQALDRNGRKESTPVYIGDIRVDDHL